MEGALAEIGEMSILDGIHTLQHELYTLTHCDEFTSPSPSTPSTHAYLASLTALSARLLDSPTPLDLLDSLYTAVVAPLAAAVRSAAFPALVSAFLAALTDVTALLSHLPLSLRTTNRLQSLLERGLYVATGDHSTHPAAVSLLLSISDLHAHAASSSRSGLGYALSAIALLEQQHAGRDDDECADGRKAWELVQTSARSLLLGSVLPDSQAYAQIVVRQLTWLRVATVLNGLGAHDHCKVIAHTLLANFLARPNLLATSSSPTQSETPLVPTPRPSSALAPPLPSRWRPALSSGRASDTRPTCLSGSGWASRLSAHSSHASSPPTLPPTPFLPHPRPSPTCTRTRPLSPRPSTSLSSLSSTSLGFSPSRPGPSRYAPRRAPQSTPPSSSPRPMSTIQGLALQHRLTTAFILALSPISGTSPASSPR